MKLLLAAVLLSVNLLAIVSGNEGELRDQGRTLTELIEQLDHNDFEVRRSAARTLEQKGPEARGAIDALIEALEDKDEYVRAAAGRALGKIGPEAERAIPALMKLIKDHVMIVRMGAAVGLGGIGPKAMEAIPLLAEALESQNEDHNVKYRAAEALGAIGSEAVPALTEAVKNNQYFVRRISARALGNTGAAAAVGPLIEALEDDDRNVRSISAQMLGKIGPDAKEAVPALKKALQDKHYSTRWRATRSLWLIRTGAKISEKTSIFPRGESKDGLAAFLLSHKRRFEIGEPIPLYYGLILVGSGLDQCIEEAHKLRAKVWRPRSPVNPNNASWFEVRGPDGARVSYRGFYVSGAMTKPSDENTALLRHGEFIGRHHSDLCEYEAFYLNESGIYTVRWFYRPFFGEDGLWSGKLVSNELQIEIFAHTEAEQSESVETDKDGIKD